MNSNDKYEYIMRARAQTKRYVDVLVDRNTAEVLSTGIREDNSGAWVTALVWVGPLTREHKIPETNFDLKDQEAQENLEQEMKEFGRTKPC